MKAFSRIGYWSTRSALLFFALGLPAIGWGQPQEVAFAVRFIQADASVQDSIAAKRAPRRDNQPAPLSAADFLGSGVAVVHRLRDDADIAGILALPANRSRLERLREPVLKTPVGREVLYVIGDRYPIPVIEDPAALDPLASPNPPGSPGGLQVTAAPPQLPVREFGLRLRLLPLLLPDGNLRIRVRATVTAPDFSQATTRGGYFVPAIATRAVDTHLDVKSGQSFALTGLLDAEIVRKLRRVPGIEKRSLMKAVLNRQETKPGTALVLLVTPELQPAVKQGER